MIGYCLGGTLLAATLAYLAGRATSAIASRDVLHALIDFTEPGELGVFIDEEQLQSARAQDAASAAISKAREMARPSTCCAPTT